MSISNAFLQTFLPFADCFWQQDRNLHRSCGYHRWHLDASWFNAPTAPQLVGLGCCIAPQLVGLHHSWLDFVVWLQNSFGRDTSANFTRFHKLAYFLLAENERITCAEAAFKFRWSRSWSSPFWKLLALISHKPLWIKCWGAAFDVCVEAKQAQGRKAVPDLSKTELARFVAQERVQGRLRMFSTLSKKNMHISAFAYHLKY